MPAPPPQDHFIVPAVAAWRAWLHANEDTHDGLWLVLAKKGVTEPTSLTYDQALEEALCSGWIDGQLHSRDAATFLQRFVPRRKRSVWSQRNVERIADLEAQGRMRPRGWAEVDAAKADGRWGRAYAGSATATVPDDLAAALDAEPALRTAFDALKRAEQYSILHPLMVAPNAQTRARRLAKALNTLRKATNP